MLIKVLMVAEQGYLEEKPHDLGDTETQKNFWIYRKKNQQQCRDDQTIYQESINQNVSFLRKYHYNRDNCKFWDSGREQ